MSYVKLSLFKQRRSRSESTVSLALSSDLSKERCWINCKMLKDEVELQDVGIIIDLFVYPSVMVCRNIMQRQVKRGSMYRS